MKWKLRRKGTLYEKTIEGWLCIPPFSRWHPFFYSFFFFYVYTFYINEKFQNPKSLQFSVSARCCVTSTVRDDRRTRNKSKVNANGKRVHDTWVTVRHLVLEWSLNLRRHNIRLGCFFIFFILFRRGRGTGQDALHILQFRDVAMQLLPAFN